MSAEGPMDGPDLAALIGSRICHDLISPVGAIGNGVELMAMSGNASPELALITQSVANANARIRFFRVAFGVSSPGQQIARSELASILDDVYRGSRLTVTWDVAQDCLRAEARTVFLAVLCLETAMPYGGQVAVRHSGETWQIVGRAEKLKVDSALWSMLNGRTIGDVTANHVHFALVPYAVARLGRHLTVDRRDDGIALEF